MARIDSPPDPLADLAFEVERFEWTSDDRIEVSGRWFGVRGRRFMRPTLHLRVDGRRRRLIALLDHKPWSPDTEEPWTAVFAWRGPHGAVTAPRLEVSPDVVVDLPLPGSDAAGATLTPRPRPRREPRPAVKKPPAEDEQPAAEKPAAPKRRAKQAPPAEPQSPPAAAASESPPAGTAPDSPPPAAPDSPPADTPDPPPAAAGTAPDSPPAATPDSPPADTPDPPPTAAGTAPDSPPPLDSPPAPTPPRAAPEPSSVAGDITLLALERRLVEERAERERLAEELAAARAEIAAMSSHHASAIERANEVVRLEGELAAALVRAETAERRSAALGSQVESARSRGSAAAHELAEAREELAETRTPIEVAPLPSRVQRRRERSTDRWGPGARAAAIGVVLVLLVLIIATIL